jgi:lysophospholipase L1-like esterase
MRALKIILVISLLFNTACILFMAVGGMCFDSKNSVSKKMTAFVHRPKSTFFMGKDLLFDVLPKDPEAIVFLGDSHTEHFYLEELLQQPHLKNRGISGDRVKRMLERLDPICAMQPKKIFIQGGINDLGTGASKEQVMENYQLLIEKLHNETPQTEIFIQSIFPTVLKSESTYCNPKVNQDIRTINNYLKTNASKKGYTYIEIYDSLVLNGTLNPMYSFDGIHLTPEGYFVWAKIVKPYLKSEKSFS